MLSKLGCYLSFVREALVNVNSIKSVYVCILNSFVSESASHQLCHIYKMIVCYFQDSWLKNDQYIKWVRKKDSDTAFCQYCSRDIKVGNMGELTL